MNADLGMFIQDTWTTKRLTLSPGLRWDHFNSSIPAQDAAAGRFVPARHFDAIAERPELEQRRRRGSARPTICSGNGKTAPSPGRGVVPVGHVFTPGRGLRRLGDAHAGADDPYELLPLAGVLGGQRRDLLVFGSLFADVYFLSQYMQTGLGSGPWMPA